MSDTTLNQFVASGTAAEMALFTPSPPTVASGPDSGYFWYQTDTGKLYSWDGAAWQAVGSGTVTNTGTLTANAIVLGNGGVDVAPLGSLGTTTTVLHGNAAGAPTFSAVDLTADVSGDLPFSSLVQASAASKLIGRGSASGAGDFQEITLGSGLAMSGTTLTASGTGVTTVTHVVGITIDGGGSVITTGVKGFVAVPYAGTITQVVVLSTDSAATSGSIVIDVWKDTYANYPPTVADTITASAKPTLSSANKSLDTTLTGWTTSITAGDVIGFNVDSVTTCTRVTLELIVTGTT